MVALFISSQTVISNSCNHIDKNLSNVSLVCFLALSVRSDTKPQWLHWICFSCAAYFELLLQFRGCCTSCSCSSSKLGPLASSFGATTNTGAANTHSKGKSLPLGGDSTPGLCWSSITGPEHLALCLGVNSSYVWRANTGPAKLGPSPSSG